MNTTFQEAFEAELATISRVSDVSEAAAGWGCDLSCTDDVTDDFAELPGDDPQVVAEYTYRRLNTRPGELADDPDWGFDIRSGLSRGYTTPQIRNYQNEVRAEVARDDRLTNVEVTAEYSFATEALSVTISAEIIDSDNEFLMTVVVNKSGSNLVELIVNGRPTAVT